MGGWNMRLTDKQVEKLEEDRKLDFEYELWRYENENK